MGHADGRGNNQVLLISLTGDDAAGGMLRNHWGAMGQLTHGILQAAGASTPSVVCLLGPGASPFAKMTILNVTSTTDLDPAQPLQVPKIEKSVEGNRKQAIARIHLVASWGHSTSNSNPH